MFARIVAAVRRDYFWAGGVAGYVRNRLLEKSTWGAIGAAVIAANELKPLFAAASILVALVVALLPSPSKI